MDGAERDVGRRVARNRRASLGDVVDLASPDGVRLALALAAVLRSLPERGVAPPMAAPRPAQRVVSGPR
jgi:hypothetical protein